jgi:hypothetical protein
LVIGTWKHRKHPQSNALWDGYLFVGRRGRSGELITGLLTRKIDASLEKGSDTEDDFMY